MGGLVNEWSFSRATVAERRMNAVVFRSALSGSRFRGNPAALAGDRGDPAGLPSGERPAFWLLVPYLAWVSFAAVLNGALWRLNS
jgi:hypothetical protein